MNSASIAPIVRLKFLIGMNDQSRFLENLGSILAWASAEMNVGMFVANLPACRPILESLISRFSAITHSGISGGTKKHARGPSRADPSAKQYLELDERPDSTTCYLNGHNKTKGTGVETRIYGDLDADSSLDIERDDGSQKRIVKEASIDGFQVNVRKDFKFEVNGNKSLPKVPGDDNV
jgi:hypothetical protein